MGKIPWEQEPSLSEKRGPSPISSPDAETIALLRDLLRQAEAGELQSLIYSAEQVGGHIQSGRTTLIDCYSLIGQLEPMKYLLQRALDENMEIIG